MTESSPPTVDGSTPASPGAGDGPKFFMRQELEDMVCKEFKPVFLKQRCAVCNNLAVKKRFKESMPAIVVGMLETFWCKDCGRICCEKCLYSHTCEKLEQEKEKRKHLTGEQLAAQIAEAEAIKAAAEEQKKTEKRAKAEADEARRREMKDKRKLLAYKAQTVSGFVQHAALDTDANAVRGTRVRDELLEIYTKVNRASLRLYNEYESPSVVGLDEEEWELVKTSYKRAVQLLGMIAMVDGQPLDLRNPWDPPDPPEAQT